MTTDFVEGTYIDTDLFPFKAIDTLYLGPEESISMSS